MKTSAAYQSFIPLTLKNKSAIAPVTQRLFHPDHVDFICRLQTVKDHLGDVFASPAALRPYLQDLYRDAQGLGIYNEYIGHTSVTADGKIYGARADENKIGGGAGYPAVSGNVTVTATTDDELKVALQSAKAGDVILVKDDVIIDMTDWVLGGEVEGFTPTTGKIKYEVVIPEGVTLMGERGRDGKRGTVILFSSYTDIAIRLEKNARLSGVVVQGPDTPFCVRTAPGNHSIGILIHGDGAQIDNCEISGFSRRTIVVKDCKNVMIHHNYIHHVLGKSGIALQIDNASVWAHHNLFSRVCTPANILGGKLDFADNVVVADKLNDDLFVSRGDANLKNNTFLCAGSFAAAGNYVADKNLFAYSSDVYGVGGDNAFDILAPKTAEGKAMEAKVYLPETVGAPEVNLTLSHMPILSTNFFSLGFDDAYRLLAELIGCGDGDICTTVKQRINDMLNYAGNYSNYLDYLDADKVTFEIDGERYGALRDERGEIGGGKGYFQIFSEKDADFICSTPEALRDAIADAKDGDILYIPEDAVLDLTDAEKNEIFLYEVDKAVTICSNRGYLHEDGRVSTGGIVTATLMQGKCIFTTLADGVRFSGVNFRGPDPSNHVSLHRHAFSQGHFDLKDPAKPAHKYYYNMPCTRGLLVGSDNVEIDNCEISGFAIFGIGQGLRKADNLPVRGTRVHHCYIHHNQSNGFGYGFSCGNGYGEIDCCMFNFNRHSIQASGSATNAYYARNNVEMGKSLSDYFDMHGGKDRHEDNTIAGEYCYITNNAFLGPYNPYNIRGECVKERSFDFNVVYKSREECGKYISHARYGTGDRVENALIGKNVWAIGREGEKLSEG